jgi:hypothetical protein
MYAVGRADVLYAADLQQQQQQQQLGFLDPADHCVMQVTIKLACMPPDGGLWC